MIFHGANLTIEMIVYNIDAQRDNITLFYVC